MIDCITEETPTDADAISRQAVLEGLASIAKDKAKSDTQKSLMGRVMFFVEQLPSVTPLPKMGKCRWIKYDYRTICPKEHDAYNPYWRIPEDRKEVLKYCPYCGLQIEIEGGE